MSRDTRSKRSQTPPSERASLLGLAARLLVVGIAVAALGIAAGLVMRALNQQGSPGDIVQIDLGGSSGLNPVERAALRAYLVANEALLEQPARPGADPAIFTVEPGQSASQVADRLLAEGLVTNATLLKNYLRYFGLDVRIEAGSYELSAGMTIPEIAYALSEARPPEVTVRATEGWRREQLAEWIDQQPDLPFSGTEFLAVTSNPALLPPDSALARETAPSAPLEGFLFPDTYRLAIDATAGDLVRRMLDTFEERVTPQMRADASARGLTLYEAVTLASIVEREAIVPDERPVIASVFLNRLAVGMKLEADPTVQYAMGYQPDTGQWWNLNLTQADYHNVDSPYNTYIYPGIPPGPIASPGLDSIRAVIYPAETPYLFFRSACDHTGRHNFAVTFEEHIANACP